MTYASRPATSAVPLYRTPNWSTPVTAGEEVVTDWPPLGTEGRGADLGTMETLADSSRASRVTLSLVEMRSIRSPRVCFPALNPETPSLVALFSAGR